MKLFRCSALVLIWLLFIKMTGIFAATAIVIPAGTLVRLNLEEALSTRSSKTGEMVSFSVVEEIKIGSRVIIKKGAKATAQLEKVRRPGSFGRNGSLKIRYISVTTANGKELPITLGDKSIKTNKEMGLAAGASLGGYVLLGPIGLIGGTFVKGKHIDMPKGTQLVVETAQNTTF